jgi:hypothetical protein
MFRTIAKATNSVYSNKNRPPAVAARRSLAQR